MLNIVKATERVYRYIPVLKAQEAIFEIRICLLLFFFQSLSLLLLISIENRPDE